MDFKDRTQEEIEPGLEIFKQLLKKTQGIFAGLDPNGNYMGEILQNATYEEF